MFVSKGFSSAFLAFLILFLSACSGEGDTSPGETATDDVNLGDTIQTGIIIDSFVSNLNYRTETIIGYTNSSGEFSYKNGESITFSIGDIDFPSAQAKSIITPLDLANSSDPKHPVVINIARLLQSLDEDGNPENGIRISPLAHASALSMSMSVDFESPNFALQVTNLIANSGSERTVLVDESSALAHLIVSLNISGDTDNDTIQNANDNCPSRSNTNQLDTDHDGQGDVCDTTPNGPDTDGDTILDSSDNCVNEANSNQLDTDLDGLGDVCDTSPNDQDADGDSVLDSSDNCPYVANTNQLDRDNDGQGDVCDTTPNGSDADGDSILDSSDNCPNVTNTNQLDRDNDGQGDACDTTPNGPDADGDSILDSSDNCPNVANTNQLDTDNDGQGDVCDTAPNGPDTDGDSILNSSDNCPNIANTNQLDRDNDGQGDVCDTAPNGPDADGDSILDSSDNCLNVANANQLDTDKDGQGDVCDTTPNGPDTDGDGIGDASDLFPVDVAASVDSDYDGYPDTWNEAYTENDSTTGLIIDSYPNDAACYLPEHGDGVNCDYGATIPNYIPDQIVSDSDGIIYLLSRDNARIYRWSVAESAYINPFVVGLSTGSSTEAPISVTYSSAHDRLYLGYSTGVIQYIDLLGNAQEKAFASTAEATKGLTAADNYVFAQDSSDFGTHYIFDVDGNLTDSKHNSYHSREYIWSETQSRIYFSRDHVSPTDLNYVEIDQSTGLITGKGDTPYHGDYDVQHPVRISTNGQYIIVGKGDIYNSGDLTWAGTIGGSIDDALWLPGGSLVTLQTDGDTTKLQRSNELLTPVEKTTFSGVALRIFSTNVGMVLLTSEAGTVTFHRYIPNNDSDSDGIENTTDAFPQDIAASVDSDYDGYPDAWNIGSDENNSTTSLVLDSYPDDTACYLPEHGDGLNCSYDATIPDYVPDQIVTDNDGIVYLLSRDNARIYRWSVTESAYINPFVVGLEMGLTSEIPDKMIFSESHNRLYLGYNTGAIQYIDLAGDPKEKTFTKTTTAVTGLAAVGSHVFASDASGVWGNSHYFFDTDGNLTDSDDRAYWEGQGKWRDYAWNQAQARMYYFRSSNTMSRPPYLMQYEEINQSTGEILSSEEVPDHGVHRIHGPIRISANGDYIFLSSGDMYNSADLTWANTIGSSVDDALWLSDDSLVTLHSDGEATVLRHYDATLILVEQVVFNGNPLGIFYTDAGMVVLTSDSGTVKMQGYIPNNDRDGDGIVNALDAFPVDEAAAIDGDHDGYPDAWNLGYNENDSTTGLSLDSYPDDAACYLLIQGDGLNCDYEVMIPNYVPDQIISGNGIVYLLSQDNARVYRWSVADAAYINPLVVGLDKGVSTESPNRMAYSATHDRLYLTYSKGIVQYVDLQSDLSEQFFAKTAFDVGGLAVVEGYLIVEDAYSSWHNLYVFDANGNLNDSKNWSGSFQNGSFQNYAWSLTNTRMYYLSDSSTWYPLYMEIDENTGLIGDSDRLLSGPGASHLRNPIVLSKDETQIIMGSGDIFDLINLNWVDSLEINFVDAIWQNQQIITVENTTNEDGTSSSLVTLWDEVSLQSSTVFSFEGSPLAFIPNGEDVILIHSTDAGLSFSNILVSDHDDDGLPGWWENRHGLDDDNSADVVLDNDTDGLTNLEEFNNATNPLNADSDGDGLSDGVEVHNYGSDPNSTDGDGDKLSDFEEVITTGTSPIDSDSDNDSFNDGEEVIDYLTDPNNASSHPPAVANMTKSFEGSELPGLWESTAISNVAWTIDGTQTYDGKQSLRVGGINRGQQSAIQYENEFEAGTLSFQAKFEFQSCCEELTFWVDGSEELRIYSNTWKEYSVTLSSGFHVLEWRYSKNPVVTRHKSSAWIDYFKFVSP